MSVSAIFGSRLVMPSQSLPASASSSALGSSGAGNLRRGSARAGIEGGGLAIECSSRPKKKATAHHMKTRPRKTQPWDIKRKPTVYPPLPPLPPDWTLVSSASEASSIAPPSPPPADTPPSLQPATTG